MHRCTGLGAHTAAACGGCERAGGGASLCFARRRRRKNGERASLIPTRLSHFRKPGGTWRRAFAFPFLVAASDLILLPCGTPRGREGMSRCRHRSDCSLLRAVTTVGITRVRVPLTMISTLVPPLCQHRRKLNACHLHNTCALQKVRCSHDTRQMDSDHR